VTVHRLPPPSNARFRHEFPDGGAAAWPLTNSTSAIGEQVAVVQTAGEQLPTTSGLVGGCSAYAVWFGRLFDDDGSPALERFDAIVRRAHAR
jgi:hypothetical protein